MPEAVEVASPALGKLKTKPKPPRIILNAVEGWGKTSCGSYTPNPAIIMAAGETGYETLLHAGRVPDVSAAYVSNWGELLALLKSIEDGGSVGTIVIDALGGIERMCHEAVCNRDFAGDWGEKGFLSFHKGYDLSIRDWLIFIAALDRLHARGCGILLLSHCKIKQFKNPVGPDYDRYVADVHDKTWSVTSKWADAVLFGTFYTVVEGGSTGAKPRKGKGIGGSERVLYTERRDAFDAKNRFGMPEIIDIPADPTQIWSTISQHLKGVSL